MRHFAGRLSARLSLGFGTVLLLLAVQMGLALFVQGRLTDRARGMITVDGAKGDAVVEMLRHVNAAALRMRNLSVINNPAELGEEYKSLSASLESFDAAQLAFAELLDRVGASEAERAQWAKVKLAEKAAREILSLAAQGAQGNAADDLAIGVRVELRKDLARWNASQSAWIRDMDELRQLEVDASRQSFEAMNATAAQARWLLATVAAAALIVGLVCAVRITRDVSSALKHAVEAANRIASGDLSQAIAADEAGEVGELLTALERMRAGLHELATQVKEASDRIRDASAEIASGNMALSTRTEHTAASLQSTAASLGVVQEAVSHTADAAVQATQLAATATEMAQRGGAAMGNVESNMTEVTRASAKIAEIVVVISEFAFQTNVLSLNAAVEASHAGEHGRGFAVVAGEIRALAKRSADAAQEIKELIEAATEKVGIGSKLVRDADAAMADILAAVQRVSGIVPEISASVTNQRMEINRVNQSAAQLDSMTQQNAALVEQAAAAAASLMDQASRLGTLVDRFRLRAGEEEAAAAQ